MKIKFYKDEILSSEMDIDIFKREFNKKLLISLINIKSSISNIIEEGIEYKISLYDDEGRNLLSIYRCRLLSYVVTESDMTPLKTMIILYQMDNE